MFGFAHWPGKIAPAVSNATASTLDFVPTIAALAGVKLPSDRVYDGYDLAPVLFGGAAAVREFLFMSDGKAVSAVWYDPAGTGRHFKLYTATVSSPPCTGKDGGGRAWPNYLIFDLDADPAESTPITLPPADIARVTAALASYNANVSTTFASVADYSSGTMVADAPCCNATNAVCRCKDS